MQPNNKPFTAAASNEVERLKTLHQLELLDTRPEPVFDRVTELARDLFETPIAVISLVDKDRQWFKSNLGLSIDETPREVAFCNHAIKGNGVYVVPDATAVSLFRNNPLVIGEPHIRFYAGAPLEARNGRKIGTLCVIDRKPRDFSERDRKLLTMLAEIVIIEAENRLLRRRLVRRSAVEQKGKRAADASSEAKAEFLSNVSHELRTPVHAILNYAKIASKKRAPGGQGQRWDTDSCLTNITNSCERLLVLIDDLLDLEKLEAGKVHFEFALSDVSNLLRDAVSELGPLLENKKLKVAFVVRDTDCRIAFDRRSMFQVIVNLLSNAIKFSPEGGLVTITLAEATLAEALEPKGERGLCCSIDDEGPGIPDSELEAVFDKFVQSRKTKGGTGLGLSICKNILKAHRGKIWAEGSRAGGASIRFILPRASRPQPPQIAALP